MMNSLGCSPPRTTPCLRRHPLALFASLGILGLAATAEAALKTYEISVEARYVTAPGGTPPTTPIVPGAGIGRAVIDDTSPPVLVRLVLPESTSFSLSGLTVDRELEIAALPFHAASSGSLTTSIPWGTVSGFSITGSVGCNSSPPILCQIAGLLDGELVAPSALSGDLDLGTWTFSGLGTAFSAPPFFVQEVFPSGLTDHIEYQLSGAGPLSEFIVRNGSGGAFSSPFIETEHNNGFGAVTDPWAAVPGGVVWNGSRFVPLPQIPNPPLSYLGVLSSGADVSQGAMSGRYRMDDAFLFELEIPNGIGISQLDAAPATPHVPAVLRSTIAVPLELTAVPALGRLEGLLEFDLTALGAEASYRVAVCTLKNEPNQNAVANTRTGALCQANTGCETCGRSGLHSARSHWHLCGPC